MAVSSYGKMLATASAQLKTFDCSNHKKIQKFSGHPGAVQCMVFTEDGKFILSSAVGERYGAMWRTDGGKKQLASCLLAMEHPAVFVDSRCVENGVLYVFAISENGMLFLGHKGALPAIFAAKLQGVPKPALLHAFLAYGLLVKPSFKKIVMHYGTDVMWNSSQDGVLLPTSQTLIKSKKGLNVQNRVTALDCANAEDALIPIPVVSDLQDQKDRYQNLSIDVDEEMADLVGSVDESKLGDGEEDMVELDAGSKMLCIGDRPRSLGMLHNLTSDSTLDATMFNGIQLEASMLQKNKRTVVLCLAPSDAQKLLENLVALWQSKSDSRRYVLPWIYSISVNHSQHNMSQETVTQMLDSLLKITKSKRVAIQSSLQLSGHLQLATTQTEKATWNKTHPSAYHQMDESDDEDDSEDERLGGRR
ncbi:hypothetical protein SLE2022_253640 [Rubroshorea leprosula]